MLGARAPRVGRCFQLYAIYERLSADILPALAQTHPEKSFLKVEFLRLKDVHVSSFMYSINRHLFTLLISPTCPLPRTHLPMFSPVRGIIKFRIRPSEGILLPASEHVLMETTSHLQPRLLSLFEYINHSKSHFWPRFH